MDGLCLPNPTRELTFRGENGTFRVWFGCRCVHVLVSTLGGSNLHLLRGESRVFSVSDSSGSGSTCLLPEAAEHSHVCGKVLCVCIVNRKRKMYTKKSGGYVFFFVLNEH